MCTKCNKEINLIGLVSKLQKLAMKLSETVFSKEKENVSITKTRIEELKNLCDDLTTTIELRASDDNTDCQILKEEIRYYVNDFVRFDSEDGPRIARICAVVSEDTYELDQMDYKPKKQYHGSKLSLVTELRWNYKRLTYELDDNISENTSPEEPNKGTEDSSL